MTTYAELARELGFGEDFEGFRTWADMHDVAATDEAGTGNIAFLREAMAAQPAGPVDVVTENRNEDNLMDELAHIVDRAGYDDELGDQL